MSLVHWCHLVAEVVWGNSGPQLTQSVVILDVG